MAEAYIVDAVRSPTGRRKGGLAHVHGADLGAHVLKAIVERNGIPDNEYIAAVGAFCGAGDYVWLYGCGRGGRCADHDANTHFIGDDSGCAIGI